MTDYRGRTPIHLSTINGNLPIVTFLIERGDVNLDAMDREGKTALYYACVRKYPKIVDMLIKKGASVQVKPQKLV